jgi:hypothetical protein
MEGWKNGMMDFKKNKISYFSLSSSSPLFLHSSAPLLQEIPGL